MKHKGIAKKAGTFLITAILAAAFAVPVSYTHLSYSVESLVKMLNPELSQEGETPDWK